MKPIPAIEAVRQLANMGYRFTVTGETVKANYEGQGEPDPLKVKPLLDLARQHKPEVVDFLRCFCPRCGGCCFAPDYEGRPLCLACDWGLLVELYPDLKVRH
jgi:hypothetical protein